MTHTRTSLWCYSPSWGKFTSLGYRYEQTHLGHHFLPWNVNIHLHYFSSRKDGRPDRSYFAPDCFHLSQKAHTLMARALWNNMVGVLHFSSVTCVSLFTAHITITDRNVLLVRTSGQQNIYAGFWSWYRFEVPLQGTVSSFEMNNTVVFLSYMSINERPVDCDQTSPFFRTAVNSNHTFPDPLPTTAPPAVGHRSHLITWYAAQ